MMAWTSPVLTVSETPLTISFSPMAAWRSWMTREDIFRKNGNAEMEREKRLRQAGLIFRSGGFAALFNNIRAWSLRWARDRRVGRTAEGNFDGLRVKTVWQDAVERFEQAGRQ